MCECPVELLVGAARCVLLYADLVDVLGKERNVLCFVQAEALYKQRVLHVMASSVLEWRHIISPFQAMHVACPNDTHCEPPQAKCFLFSAHWPGFMVI